MLKRYVIFKLAFISFGSLFIFNTVVKYPWLTTRDLVTLLSRTYAVTRIKDFYLIISNLSSQWMVNLGVLIRGQTSSAVSCLLTYLLASHVPYWIWTLTGLCS
jgi:hypothetical protein